MTSPIRTERHDEVLVIISDNPPVNALGAAVRQGLEAAVREWRQVLAHGFTEAEIAEQSYYRWRNEYGGLAIEQAKRFKEIERENARLKRLVADLSLEKQILKDVASGNL